MGDCAGKRTLYLVDGTAQLFRAYFAIRGLSNADGLPTNAVFGFTNMLRKMLEEERPDHVAVAFDLGGEVFRHATYADYKANRPPVPEDLDVQAPYAKRACEALGVSVVELAGYEADDLIATLTRQARQVGFDVVVVASDKDLLQLVGDGVTVLNPSKNLRLDVEGVAREFGVPPERVRDVLGLMGDSVDNIPGVPGVGEKTAIALVSSHGDLERVIARSRLVVELFQARDALLDLVEAALGERPAEGLARGIDRMRRSLAALSEFEAARESSDNLAGLADDLDRLASDGDTGKTRARRLREIKRDLKALDRGSSKRVWIAIDEHADQARMSKALATLDDHAPVDADPSRYRYRGPDRDRARVLFDSLGFKGLGQAFGLEEPSTGRAAGAGEERGRYDTVLDEAALGEVVEAARAAGRFALRAETDGSDPRRARLLGLSISVEPGSGVYVPLAHVYVGAPEQLGLDTLRRVVGPLLSDATAGKLAHDLKYAGHVLARHGLSVAGWVFDTMVAAFLLNSERSRYRLDALASEYLGLPPDSSAAGTAQDAPASEQIDVERATVRAGRDADLTLRLGRELERRLDEARLRRLYDTIDGPLLPILQAMETHGIRVDVGLLARMSEEMERSLEVAREKIHRLAGTEFNVDSPKQLREILYDRLGLRPRRKTAKSKVASTDAQTLEELADDAPIARLILEYRELAKLKGTYVDALPRLVDAESGRVHTCYNPTGAATGRLSSSDPNLQNIPARTEAGRKIRSAFVPEPGWRFLASDYSQVELRVLAHLSEDRELIAAFQAGDDIHRYTAARIAGVPIDLVTDAMRRKAKAVNFGILYGMSETRLAREQGIPRAEARGFIHAYFERFSAVRAYIDRVREAALREAAVRTLFGRVRYFPQLHQRVNRAVQEQALRAAVNTTIQGTAADLMKMAMLAVDRRLQADGGPARMLLQVHDELLLEAPADRIDSVARVVRQAMESVHPLNVPLVVDQKQGANWEDAS
ncbi:MAG TPA: DNA polymerase I [Candidatus Polarisedimenticolaceae bacterium]|nr:DNA polymerase I [Candidatus Polarisedimenticolaceae bacterium]